MLLFGFEFYLSILIGCVYLAGGYLLAIGPARRRWGWSDRPASRKQITAWMSAVLLIFFSLNGPLHRLSDDYLFSAHMVQHMLVMLIMPPLLIGGLPDWLIRAAIRPPGVRAVARFLTHPVTAFVAYNVVFIGWHFPVMYNWALLNHNVHIAQHLTFMAVSVMMWWPVVNPVKELEVIPTGPILILYVFVFGIPATALSAILTLSDRVFYPWYALAPRVTSLSPLDDQRLGGLIMWVPGMLIFWTAMSVVFFRWTKDEYRDWGGWGRKKGSGAALVLPFLLLLLPQDAAAQGGRTTRFETELGASVFFGNTEQVTFTNRTVASRADSAMEVSGSWNFTYGEATNEDGETFVNRRNWTASSSLDFRPHGRVSPFFFGTLEYSMQRRIDQRFSGGAGGKLTFVRTNGSLLDLSAAALAERTVPADRSETGVELLARWSVRLRARRSFQGNRLVLASENLWVPAFRDAADFTFSSTSSVSLAMSNRVSLRFSFVDQYDSGAIDRGARTNNDGQLLFSILTRL